MSGVTFRIRKAAPGVTCRIREVTLGATLRIRQVTLEIRVGTIGIAYRNR